MEHWELQMKKGGISKFEIIDQRLIAINRNELIQVNI